MEFELDFQHQSGDELLACRNLQSQRVCRAALRPGAGPQPNRLCGASPELPARRSGGRQQCGYFFENQLLGRLGRRVLPKRLWLLDLNHRPLDAVGLSGVGESRKWLRGLDLNQRPLGYEPNELPGCSTPHTYGSNRSGSRSNRGDLARGELSPSGAVSPARFKFL
jgi:hypothetical protein